MTTIKPGYKTSEFWFTLVSFLFSGLYLVGILRENTQKEELIEIASHAVESVFLIGGQILLLVKYIKGRTAVKTAYSSKSKVKTNGNTKRKPKKTNPRTR